MLHCRAVIGEERLLLLLQLKRRKQKGVKDGSLGGNSISTVQANAVQLECSSHCVHRQQPTSIPVYMKAEGGLQRHSVCAMLELFLLR